LPQAFDSLCPVTRRWPYRKHRPHRSGPGLSDVKWAARWGFWQRVEPDPVLGGVGQASGRSQWRFGSWVQDSMSVRRPRPGLGVGLFRFTPSRGVESRAFRSHGDSRILHDPSSLRSWATLRATLPGQTRRATILIGLPAPTGWPDEYGPCTRSDPPGRSRSACRRCPRDTHSWDAERRFLEHHVRTNHRSRTADGDETTLAAGVRPSPFDHSEVVL
jgi:hypothetical protein